MDQNKRRSLCLAVLVNLVPLVVQGVLFRLGVGASVVMLIGSFFLNGWNYRCSENHWDYLCRNILMCVSAYIGAVIMSRLYFVFVSNDGATLALGKLFGLIIVVAIVISTIVMLLIQIRPKPVKDTGK